MNNPTDRHIWINGRFLSQRTTGVQRYARQILIQWDRMLANGEIDFEPYTLSVVTPPGTDGKLSLASITIRPGGRLRGHLWEQYDLPRLVRGGCLVGFGNTGPLSVRGQVVTVHDAAVFDVPESYSVAYRVWHRMLLKPLCRRAGAVITPSRFSRQRIAARCAIDPATIHVIPPAADHILDQPRDDTVLERHGLGDRRYILTVGTQAAHKNVSGVTEAVDRLEDPRLEVVVAGPQAGGVFAPTGAATSDRVTSVGYVSDGQLRSLYEHAVCFVFASRYEGFGLPPLEAMACGCPVVASDRSAIPEACGDAAVYFDPGEPAQLAEQVNRLVGDPSLQERCRQRGRQRAAEFSWAATAARLWPVVRQAAEAMAARR